MAFSRSENNWVTSTEAGVASKRFSSGYATRPQQGCGYTFVTLGL
jgi:hypothetical protein